MKTRKSKSEIEQIVEDKFEKDEKNISTIQPSVSTLGYVTGSLSHSRKYPVSTLVIFQVLNHKFNL